MTKISIIMPSLNVANYIKPCMESVLQQTLKELEILAIDAGSTDGTLEILREFEREDTRVRVIVSDKRSYGYQMNLGLMEAKGEYIGIVETDDIVERDMFETLYKTACEKQVDYVKLGVDALCSVAGGAVWRTPVGNVFTDDLLYGMVLSPCEMPEILVRDIYLWKGIYRKSFLEGIRFHETPGAAFQDQGFLLQTIGKAKKAVYLKQVGYLYRQDNANSSIKNHNGFRYLVGEYGHNHKYLEGKGKAWYAAFYMRLLNQCIGRLETMAAGGEFWQDAVGDMDILRQWLGEAVQQDFLRHENLLADRAETLDLFLQSPMLAYEKYEKRFLVKRELLEKLFTFVGNKKVVIFGCGKWGKFLHVLLDAKLPGQTIAYCDNQIELWGTKVQGMTVLSPKEAVSDNTDVVFVIANKNHVDAIRQQLQSFGVEAERMEGYTLGVDLSLLLCL